MKNKLLCNPGKAAEIRGRHPGQQRCHRALHPHIQRERLQAVHAIQQGAVGNLDAHTGDFHQRGARRFIVQRAAGVQIHLNEGAILVGSQNPFDYDLDAQGHPALLLAPKGFTTTGLGGIDLPSTLDITGISIK